MPAEEYEYDVCLSFAGEQRTYVEHVAEQLTRIDIRVFYDMYEQANLWGKDLYEHLDEVYQQKAKYCLLFISADYARKVWTNHERKSAQARAFQESQEYILPIRFDDTTIPGIRATVGYIDVRSTTPSQLINLVQQKVRGSVNSHHIDGERAGYQPNDIPRTLHEQQILLETKPLAWEHLLFGGVLIQGRRALQAKIHNHKLHFSHRIRHFADDSSTTKYISEAMTNGSWIMGEIMKSLDPASQRWAFGEPGEPGNADNIIRLAERLIRSYEDMLDWSADLRGTMTSTRLRRAIELASQMLDLPIRQVDEFIDNYVELLVPALERLARGESVSLSLSLTLTADENLAKQIHRELKKARLSR